VNKPGIPKILFIASYQIVVAQKKVDPLKVLGLVLCSNVRAQFKKIITIVVGIFEQ